jgi:hypothetical protein
MNKELLNGLIIGATAAIGIYIGGRFLAKSNEKKSSAAGSSCTDCEMMCDESIPACWCHGCPAPCECNIAAKRATDRMRRSKKRTRNVAV